MEKNENKAPVSLSKLGVSVTVLAALMYFCGYFGGYLVTIALGLYILLVEEDLWLKKSAVRAISLLVLFSLLEALLGFIPTFMDIIRSLLNIFGTDFGLYIVDNIVNFFRLWLGVIEKAVFILFGILAVFGIPKKLPLIDTIVKK